MCNNMAYNIKTYRNNITKYELIQPYHSTLNVKDNAKRVVINSYFHCGPWDVHVVLYDIGRSKQIGSQLVNDSMLLKLLRTYNIIKHFIQSF